MKKQITVFLFVLLSLVLSVAVAFASVLDDPNRIQGWFDRVPQIVMAASIIANLFGKAGGKWGRRIANLVNVLAMNFTSGRVKK